MQPGSACVVIEGDLLSRPTVAVIIVTYCSNRVLELCLKALDAQSRKADLVVIVDNNSVDAAYIDKVPVRDNIKVIRNEKNEGFCVGNNIGFRAARGYKYVLFLNPDAFPRVDFIAQAVEWMEDPANHHSAALTGTLLEFDLGLGRPTGAIDSTGIFQSWYGKWYDRRQGKTWSEPSGRTGHEAIPAICGAAMFCRSASLETVLLSSGEVFDSRFFMYKEDIDLSLRLRHRKWTLNYLPTLVCFHCRGWRSRRHMSKRARYLSARNELRICLNNKGKGAIYVLVKLFLVRLENAWIEFSNRANHFLTR